MKLSDVFEARGRIKDSIHITALEYSKTFSDISNNQIYLKCENMQKTGSFKVRGALNKVFNLSKDVKSVVASSAGNHAQGVAYACQKRGISAKIVMPAPTPIAKVSATANYGAQVILKGDFYDDSYDEAMRIVKQDNAVFVHPFDDEEVIAGQGTLALELLDQMPDLNAIAVPVGGGGLLAGIAFTVKQINPSIKVFGVQSQGANAVALSFKKEFTELNRIFTIADGIAVRRPGTLTMKYINQYADDILCVSDDEIASTIIHLMERTKQVVEPAGAAGLAAILNKKSNLENQKIACLLSGGNIDVSFIHKIIEKGLISRGRQMRISVVLSDIPGSLHKFAKILGDAKANIISMQYDRVSTELNLNETILHIACEVSGFEHGSQVIKTLKENNYKLLNGNS